MKHYIIERLSWDTSGKEKETWKQCNKREVEELTFIVEDLKEVSHYSCCTGECQGVVGTTVTS